MANDKFTARARNRQRDHQRRHHAVHLLRVAMRLEKAAAFIDQELVELCRDGALRAAEAGGCSIEDVSEGFGPGCAGNATFVWCELPTIAHRRVDDGRLPPAIGCPVRFANQRLRLHGRYWKGKDIGRSNLDARHWSEQATMDTIISGPVDRTDQSRKHRKAFIEFDDFTEAAVKSDFSCLQRCRSRCGTPSNEGFMVPSNPSVGKHRRGSPRRIVPCFQECAAGHSDSLANASRDRRQHTRDLPGAHTDMPRPASVLHNPRKGNRAQVLPVQVRSTVFATAVQRFDQIRVLQVPGVPPSCIRPYCIGTFRPKGAGCRSLTMIGSNRGADNAWKSGPNSHNPRRQPAQAAFTGRTLCLAGTGTAARSDDTRTRRCSRHTMGR